MAHKQLKVKELIELLQKEDPEAIVVSYNDITDDTDEVNIEVGYMGFHTEHRWHQLEFFYVASDSPETLLEAKKAVRIF